LKKGKIGVIGAGSFGTTIANLISNNADVLLYAKYEDQVIKINETHSNRGYDINENIRATGSLEVIAQECDVIFPVVPSAGFRTLMQDLSPFVGPRHIIIHCTKGLDADIITDPNIEFLDKASIHTMSEVIRQETSAIRVGCISGPNLSREIMAGLPAATVIASEFDEVIQIGHTLLSNPNFFVFGSKELRGVEFAGAYKNIIALAGGILYGKKLGKNIEALLITRGLREMIYLGKAVGIHERAFLGTAGLGDLIATATSVDSRNFKFGEGIAKGKDIKEILGSMSEVAEGVRTLKIAHLLSNFYNINIPINNILYKIIYEDFPADAAIKYLMSYPYSADVDFLSS
jgi:glycerol-3-phosphate dehydrogenase (NAD(P)+)